MRKEFLREPNLLKNQTCLGTKQGVFRKDKTEGYLLINLKKQNYTNLICVNGPKCYPKIKDSWNNPNLECFYLVIQVASTHINYFSGLASTVVTRDSKLTPTHRPLWVHGVSEYLKCLTLIQDLPHPR